MRNMLASLSRLGVLCALLLSVPHLGGAIAPADSPEYCGSLEARGCEAWVARHRSDAYKWLSGSQTGPDGTLFILADDSYVDQEYSPLILLAYRPDGSLAWNASYSQGGEAGVHPEAFTVSPDGSRIYVTGRLTTWIWQVVTIAFDAETGERIWTTIHPQFSYPTSIAVSPDGARLYVTGFRVAATDDYLTIAYDTTTGTEQWVSHYDGGGKRGPQGMGVASDQANAVAASPDGTAIFVTGISTADIDDVVDSVTIRYDASTGTTGWVIRERDALAPRTSTASYALAVAPDSSTLYVYGTLGVFAYNATDGHTIWTPDIRWAFCPEWVPQTYPGECRIFVDPDGSRIYLRSAANIAAHDARTGHLLWAVNTRLQTDPDQYHTDMAMSPDGRRLYVTALAGALFDQLNGWVGYDTETQAYETDTGALVWRAIYDGGKDDPTSIAVSPDGGRVYVSGVSSPPGAREQLVTIAYDTDLGLNSLFS